MTAAVFRTIFAQPDAAAAAEAQDEVRDRLNESFPKTGPLTDAAKDEVLAFAGSPEAHWQKIWLCEPPLERVNKEIKRRPRVVGIFPNPASAIRLVGAILADMHDEWQASDRRYLSEESMAQLAGHDTKTTPAELTSNAQHQKNSPRPPPRQPRQPRRRAARWFHRRRTPPTPPTCRRATRWFHRRRAPPTPPAPPAPPACDPVVSPEANPAHPADMQACGIGSMFWRTLPAWEAAGVQPDEGYHPAPLTPITNSRPPADADQKTPCGNQASNPLHSPQPSSQNAPNNAKTQPKSPPLRGTQPILDRIPNSVA